jgi:Uma2 family endonuclease
MSDLALKEPSENERYFTYADYKSWELKTGERFEILEGEAYAMAAPGLYHQAIVGELHRQIANYLHGKPCKVYPAPLDVRLFYAEDESDDTVVQPDVTVICDEEKRGPEGCRGAPDMVIEILSPGNSAIEMERKFELYRVAGVREYWVIDPEHKTLHTYRFQDGRILPQSYNASSSAPVGIFSDLSISLEPVFAG